MTRAQLRFEIRRRLAEATQFASTISGTGTVAVAGGAADPYKVTGTGSAFTAELQVGAELLIGTEARQVSRIESDTILYVNAPFTTAATGATLQLLAQRGWSDESIHDAINSAISAFHTDLLNRAPLALRTRVTANLPATRTTTVPTTLADVFQVELLLDPAADAWLPLRLLSDEQWTGAGPRPAWAGWAALGITQGTGQPSAYRWIAIDTIEFDNTPTTAITNGLRFSGALASSYLDTDTATLSLPEPAKCEEIILHTATAELLMLDATQWQRAAQFRGLAAQATNALCARFNRGRQQGPVTVNLIR